MSLWFDTQEPNLYSDARPAVTDIRSSKFSNVPSKVSGVNIARQALLKAMQLLPNEMHLSSQHGLVSFPAQVVGISRNITAQGRCIVPGTNFAGKLACTQGGA